MFYILESLALHGRQQGCLVSSMEAQAVLGGATEELYCMFVTRQSFLRHSAFPICLSSISCGCHRMKLERLAITSAKLASITMSLQAAGAADQGPGPPNCSAAGRTAAACTWGRCAGFAAGKWQHFRRPCYCRPSSHRAPADLHQRPGLCLSRLMGHCRAAALGHGAHISYATHTITDDVIVAPVMRGSCAFPQEAM